MAIQPKTPPHPSTLSSTTNQPRSQPQPLSFPALTYAKLSPSPFLHAHLSSPTPTRPNTRAPSTFRSPTAHTGSLTHAHGSAVVRVGDTAVVCGVRGEILKAEDVPDLSRIFRTGSLTGPEVGDGDARDLRIGRDAIAQLGLLVPNIELATGCSPAHRPGNPPSALAQSLSQRVVTLLHISDLVPLEQLCIWRAPAANPRATSEPTTTMSIDPDEQEPPGEDEAGKDARPKIKAFWTLYIDVLFISLDGNPFDAAWAAVLAALQDTLLPRAWRDADQEAILCSPLASEAKALRLNTMPIASTFAVFEKRGPGAQGQGERAVMWVLADPDDFEESLCEEMVTVVVDGKDKQRVLRIEKSGGGAVGVEQMRECVEMAGRRWVEWRGVLKGVPGM